jgi:integrase
MPKAHLDDKFARSVERPAKDFHAYTDDNLPGYEVRVFANRIAGYYRYRPAGSSAKRRLPLGEHPNKTMAQLRTAAVAARGKVHEGLDPLAELDAIKEDRRRKEAEAEVEAVTINKAIELYTPALKDRKKSWQQDLDYFTRDLQPKFGARPIGSITTAEMSALLLAKVAVARVGANRLRSALMKFFEWCADDGKLIGTSPMVGLKKPTKQEKRKDAEIRVLTDAELVVVWKAIEASKRMSPGVKATLKVLALTGQRPAEIAGLALAELYHLNPGANNEPYADIPPERMKGGKRHVWPISEPVAAIIQREIERQQKEAKTLGRDVSPYVFASRFEERDRIARHSLSHAMRRLIEGLKAEGDDAEAVKTLKAKPPTPHKFRSTAITGMAKLKVPKEYRKAVVAHKDDDVMADHYDAYDMLDEKRLALNKWARHVMALVSGEQDAGNVIPLRA